MYNCIYCDDSTNKAYNTVTSLVSEQEIFYVFALVWLFNPLSRTGSIFISISLLHLRSLLNVLLNGILNVSLEQLESHHIILNLDSTLCLRKTFPPFSSL